jgi:hypothetical protein
MGVRIERFPEYGVTLCIYSGLITFEAALEHFDRLGPEDALRRIDYADPTTDLASVDMAATPRLRREVAARLNKLLAGRRGVAAIVSDGKTGKLTPDFWAHYVAQDESFPVEVRSFDSLEAACAWLDLPESGCRAVIAAAKDRAPRQPTSEPAPANARHAP